MQSVGGDVTPSPQGGSDGEGGLSAWYELACAPQQLVWVIGPGTTFATACTETTGRSTVARRALTTPAAAFATAAALLLTACGGGDDSSSDDTKEAGTSSPSPAASKSSAAPGVERPVIKLPSSFRLTFENWTSSDSVEQAVLDDGKEQLRAGYAAIIENDPDSRNRAFYDTKNGFLQSQQWIRTYTDKNLTVIGKLPAFDPKVTLAKDKAAASLSYCTNESKASTRNRRTGEVKGNPAGTDPEVFYVISMGRNAQGVWQAVSARSERGGCTK